jgi:flagellar secretion chaperone FliS
MATSAQDMYLESRVYAASPVELVQILYEAALDSVERARQYLRDGQIAARSSAISKACTILVELTASIRRDVDPSLAANLVELYDYMQRRLIEANVNQADAPLSEAAQLLGTLLEGWTRCSAAPTEPAPAFAPVTMEEPAETEYVRHSWTA